MTLWAESLRTNDPWQTVVKFVCTFLWLLMVTAYLVAGALHFGADPQYLRMAMVLRGLDHILGRTQWLV